MAEKDLKEKEEILEKPSEEKPKEKEMAAEAVDKDLDIAGKSLDIAEEAEEAKEADEDLSADNDAGSDDEEAAETAEEVVEEVEDVEKASKAKATNVPESWTPKTEIGRKVKAREITEIDEILNKGIKILEPEVTDSLLPNMDIELLAIGQSKGKFGGGQRRVFRQTQKKTREGNKPQFSAYAVCGNYDGYVGFGFGKAKETVPAREKAFRKCKINIIKIRRSCTSWECSCGTPHSIPYKVTGKCGSVEVTLMPAPKGTGLVAEKEIAKILKLAGIKDVWSKTKGKTKTKINHINACIAALSKLTETKVTETQKQNINIIEGSIKTDEVGM